MELGVEEVRIIREWSRGSWGRVGPDSKRGLNMGRGGPDNKGME